MRSFHDRLEACSARSGARCSLPRRRWPLGDDRGRLGAGSPGRRAAATGSPVPKDISVSQAKLTAADKDGANFLHSNMNYAQTRYYPASQINTRNVAKLQAGLRVPDRGARVDGDGADRRRRHHVPDHVVQPRLRDRRGRPARSSGTTSTSMGPVTTYCCGPNNRGVAIMGDRAVHGHARRQAGGARRQDRQGAVERRRSPIPKLGYSETMAPVAVDGKILIGTNGGEYGIRGFVKAFDANDGKLLWTFHTDSREGPRGRVGRQRRHRPQHAARHRRREEAAGRQGRRLLQDAGRRRMDGAGGRPRDATRCSSSSAIPARTCTAPSGRATTCTPTRWSPSTSNTGAYKWHFQYIAHDVWDLDAVSPVDPDRGQGQGRQDAQGRHPRRQDRPRLRARPRHRRADPHSEAMVPQENMWVLPTTDGARMLPGANGGVEWSPMAINPTTAPGLCGQPAPADDLPRRAESKYPGGKLWLGGAFKTIAGREAMGAAGGGEHRHRQDGVEVRHRAAADRRRAGHGRRPGLQRREATACSAPSMPPPARSCGSTSAAPA